MSRQQNGFSLIEVVVALFIVATVLGAAVSAVGSFAANHGHLEQRSQARWVASNLLTEAQLGLWGVEPGEVEGQQKMGRLDWPWRMLMSRPEDGDRLRITVEVFDPNHRQQLAFRETVHRRAVSQ
jgi:general secretion pathway protein I